MKISYTSGRRETKSSSSVRTIKRSLKEFIMVIDLSRVQFGLKSYAWFQNRTSAQGEFDMKSRAWFQIKIARHEVQLPLYYIHFEISQRQDLVSSNILLMRYWASLKLNSSIFFLGGGGKSFFLSIAVPCKVGYHEKALFNPPLVCPKMQIQNSVSKGVLKITTEIEQDITNDPEMRSDYNSKPTFNEWHALLGS